MKLIKTLGGNWVINKLIVPIILVTCILFGDIYKSDSKNIINIEEIKRKTIENLTRFEPFREAKKKPPKIVHYAKAYKRNGVAVRNFRGKNYVMRKGSAKFSFEKDPHNYFKKFIKEDGTHQAMLVVASIHAMETGGSFNKGHNKNKYKGVMQYDKVTWRDMGNLMKDEYVKLSSKPKKQLNPFNAYIRGTVHSNLGARMMKRAGHHPRVRDLVITQMGPITAAEWGYALSHCLGDMKLKDYKPHYMKRKTWLKYMKAQAKYLTNVNKTFNDHLPHWEKSFFPAKLKNEARQYYNFDYYKHLQKPKMLRLWFEAMKDKGKGTPAKCKPQPFVPLPVKNPIVREKKEPIIVVADTTIPPIKKNRFLRDLFSNAKLYIGEQGE